jgi:hypothetical protein
MERIVTAAVQQVNKSVSDPKEQTRKSHHHCRFVNHECVGAITM